MGFDDRKVVVGGATLLVGLLLVALFLFFGLGGWSWLLGYAIAIALGLPSWRRLNKPPF
jgi:hypothetical protein